MVEVPDTRFDLALQMPIAEDQNMVQQLTSDAADEALAHGVGFGRFDWRVNHINRVVAQ